MTLHSSNSDFSKPPAPSDQMKMPHSSAISAGTRSHPSDGKGWCAGGAVVLQVSSGSAVSALPTMLLQWAGRSSTVWTSHTNASICQARADALAGLEAVASGEPFLINQIRHVIALITINTSDRDDEDAAVSVR